MTVFADLASLAANPGVALAAAALLVPWLPAAAARLYAPAAALAALAFSLGLEPGSHVTLAAAGLELQVLRVDAGARLLATVFLAVAFLGSVYAWNEDGRIGRTAGLLLAGSATAAVYSGDLLSFLVFSGLATIGSILLIWSAGTEAALRAGMRYAVIQVAAVVLMLAGVVMHAHATGSLAFDGLTAGAAGVGLILAALAIQAAFPLLHSWLQDSYPEASPAGAVLLSAFTTKLAVYALWRGYGGTADLVWAGAVMAVLPLLAAAVEDDLRRALTWVLNSQLGLMVMAIGLGTEVAMAGALALAVTHTLSTALQFMALGAVVVRTGSARASQLGGLRRAMPLTMGFHLVGAAAAGLPLFAGAAALPLVLEAASGDTPVYLAMLAALAGGFLICLARIPCRLWLGTPVAGSEAPVPMLVAMAGMALLCLLPGLWPPLLHAALPLAVPAEAYGVVPLIVLLAAAAAGIALFVALQRTGAYPADRDRVPDIDWVYTRALPVAAAGLGRAVDTVWGRLVGGCSALLVQSFARTAAVFAPGGLASRMSPVGNSVASVIALLLVALVIGYAAG